MIEERIDFEKIIQELTANNSEDVVGFSSQELAEKLKISVDNTRIKMRDWVSKGVIECVGKRQGISIDGKKTRIPLYNIVK